MEAWYAVYTKAQQETVAEENLQRQGFETYLPWITHPRRRRGKWLDVTETLFPRYLFTRPDPAGPAKLFCGATTLPPEASAPTLTVFSYQCLRNLSQPDVHPTVLPRE